MRDFLVEFIDYNGPIIVLLIFFLAGFVSKIVSCYVYDYELDRIGAISHVRNGIIADIKIAYIDKQNCGISVNNTKVFVDNMLNMWKKYGISVARMENIGDMCAYICVAVTAFFDMVLLTERDNIGERLNVMTCVYVYTALAVIFFMVLRLWEKVVSSGYKRTLLSDAVTDYIDNELCNINDLEAVMEYLTSKEEAEQKESGAEQKQDYESTTDANKIQQDNVNKTGTNDDIFQDNMEQSGANDGISQNNMKQSGANGGIAQDNTEQSRANDDVSQDNVEQSRVNNDVSQDKAEQSEVRYNKKENADNSDNVAEDKENVITQVLDEYLA